jgi:hypothetical protein
MAGYIGSTAAGPFRSYPYSEVNRPFVLVSVQPEAHFTECASTAMLHGLSVLMTPPATTGNNAVIRRHQQSAAAVSPEPAAFRKLFAEAGIRRVLSWGEWKDALKGQLAHPELLRDSHRLPCTVQAVDAHVQSKLESLSRLLFANEKVAPPLIELSPDVATRLGVARDLSSIPLDPSAKRFFFLQVGTDPTTDLPARMTPAEHKPVSREPKRCIPEDYTRGIHFPLSRDEAIYDMQEQPSRLKQWCKAFKQRASFEKWQHLLWGKNLEEQLWTVRPPLGLWRDARVRTWAEKTLDAAGYDKSTMLSEWEIFWRRRGC